MKTGIRTLRVLVVDDNENMRSLLVGLLQSLGVEQVRQAADGEAALSHARHWRADAAFVDMKMAPMDGIEFTRIIRTAPGGADPYMPIIMLTSEAHRERVLEARDAGVTEFLVKPVNAKALVERLKTVIERQRLFVRTDSYVGPDRRRKSSAAYTGPRRRETDRE